MPAPTRSNYGRIVTGAVLSALLLTVAAIVYVYMARHGGTVVIDGLTNEEREQLKLQEATRLVTLLTILLTSALLILLFVIGTYLVIRAGQFVSRDRVGGRPTDYVDAWSEYRLSDEQLFAATDEGKSGDDSGDGSTDWDDSSPNESPDDPKQME